MSAMTSLPQRHTYYGGEVGVHTHEISGKPRKKHVTFGPYIVGSTLGEGEFGKVKLGWSKAASSPLEVPKQVAIKLIRRDSIPKNSEKEVKIYREINALKHLSHPNIVKLEEVLQNSKYIGIVLEYASGGEFYKYIQRKRRLKEAVACRLFAQLVSGVNYMHSKGLVHRDLKLENLLLDKHENLVITDFGFVNEFVSHNELMKTSCGSPCYAAPELVVSTKPYEARKSDVWSCGVILYAMLAGYLPWDDDPKNPDGNDIVRLYYYITRTPLKFPEYITALPRDLLRRILVSDPRKRLTLRSIHKHEWLKPHAAFISITPEEWDKAMSSKDVFRLPRPTPTKSKRPQSSCSTSSTGSKGEKRDSLVMDYTLVPLPAPPHQSQSHVITKPSPPSPEIRTSPVRNQFSRHSRSNSAASVALQAVVDAERDSNSMLSHPHGNGVNAVNGGTVSGNKLLPRSSTMSGTALSLLNKDSFIVETSPSKGRIIEPTDENSRMRPPLNSISNVAASRTVHRKPRPTSYHPGSMAANSDNRDPPATLSGVPNLSSTRPISVMEPSPLDSTPSLVPDAGVSSQEHSPKMLPRRSFSVSKPLLDLQSVNGDLIRSHGDAQPMARRLHEQVEDVDYKQRRQSRRYSSLFNSVTEEGEDMDQKSIAPQGKAGSHTRSRTPSKTHSRQPSDNTSTAGGPEPVEPVKGRTTTTAGVNTRDKDRKFEKKRFSFLSFYSSYNTSRSSIVSEKNPSAPPSQQQQQQQQQQQRPVDSKSSRQHLIPRMGTRNSLRASGQASTQQQPPAQQQQPPTRSRSKKNRQSMMEPSQQQVRPQGEQSTAKRVMDFFKRRSMRI